MNLLPLLTEKLDSGGILAIIRLIAAWASFQNASIAEKESTPPPTLCLYVSVCMHEPHTGETALKHTSCPANGPSVTRFQIEILAGVMTWMKKLRRAIQVLALACFTVQGRELACM